MADPPSRCSSRRRWGLQLPCLLVLCHGSHSWIHVVPRARSSVVGPRRPTGNRWHQLATALEPWANATTEEEPFDEEADTLLLTDDDDEEDYTLMSDQDASILQVTADDAALPRGLHSDFGIVGDYRLNGSFSFPIAGLEDAQMDRLELQPDNVTLPIALMIADPVLYPSLSRARKACRKGSILVARHAAIGNYTAFGDPTVTFQGRVGDRVYPGDWLGRQVRLGSGYFPILSHKKPPFELPVVYEDDHFAMVNKPAVYSPKKGGHGIMTVRAMLPFVLQPPRPGTRSVLRRPSAVHRLDKPTSGILLIAKTKPAMMHLARQFHDRVICKTYHAIVNGLPDTERSITAAEVADLGVDVDPTTEDRWHVIDQALEDKHALTVWRPISYNPSMHAVDGYLTLVELKPKTGRFHQLRRHMAWQVGKALVGDSEYDGGRESAMRFRDRGLFLCSTSVVLEHPHYNTAEGRKEWDMLDDKNKYANVMIWLSADDRVLMRAGLPLPHKFDSLLEHEAERFEKLTKK